jgi:hypothetical protein
MAVTASHDRLALSGLESGREEEVIGVFRLGKFKAKLMELAAR